MLHHPEYIVYMWFIPVFLAILLPLLAAHVIVIIDRIIAARKKRAEKILATKDLAGTDLSQGLESKIKIDGIPAGINNCHGTSADSAPKNFAWQTHQKKTTRKAITRRFPSAVSENVSTCR